MDEAKKEVEQKALLQQIEDDKRAKLLKQARKATEKQQAIVKELHENLENIAEMLHDMEMIAEVGKSVPEAEEAAMKRWKEYWI